MNESGIRNFINRRFKKLTAFIDLQNDNAHALSSEELPSVVKDDALLGAYCNCDDITKRFFLSTKGVYFRIEGRWIFFSYDNIVDATVEGAKCEHREVLITLRDGSRVKLPVEGTSRDETGSRIFYDIYSFLTFFKPSRKE